MINKLKFLFLLILCAGLLGNFTTISAQNDSKVLISSAGKTLKQSDVNSLIAFYEWAFQTEFNSTQKADFQEFTISDFRANPGESRKTIDDIINTLPKILASDEELQQATRKNFLEVFLPEAQKNNDENSQMLLSIYEAANGALPNTAKNKAENSNNDEVLTNVTNLSALSGKWVWGRSGSMTTTTSGVYLGGSGSRHTYQFSANGTVEYTGIMNMMTGGCRMQIFRNAKGKAILSGNTLTIKWSPADFSRDDSCSPSKNYKKKMPAETETFQVKLRTDSGQKQLCLIGKDETCYSSEK